ncbi:hypothetical protein HY990_02745 [Candidatus Micrarchaeota archaeon]|nr:hypothetical protein [Candidatus Micrarchaeota archaeon]
MSEPIFPDKKVLLQKDLEKTHNLLHITPFNDRNFSFSILIPKAWRMTKDLGEQKLESLRPVVLGGFYEKESSDGVSISVTFTPIPLEISLRDYLVHFNLANHITTIHLNEWFDERPFVDVGGTFISQIDGKTPYVVRTVAFFDGKGIYLISASVPKSRYVAPDGKSMTNIVIAEFSFKLLNPLGYGPLEKFIETKVPDLKYSFTHPLNWNVRVLESKLKGKSAVDLLLMHENELISYLRIKAIDPSLAGVDDVSALLQTSKAEMADSQVILQDDWKSDSDLHYKSIQNVQGTYLADGIINNTLVQLRCGIVKRGKLVFVLILMSPKNEGNPIVEMHARMIYEIVLNTVA